MGKKVLVTGADGFIGSHLVEALVEKGIEVRAFVQYNPRGEWGWMDDVSAEIKKSVEIFAADLRDPFCVRNAIKGCEKVFHLGALIAIPYSYVAPHDYVETNVKGTLNVLQAALEERVSQVIHTSTSEVYGTALYAPIDEKHPLQGQSPYSASKIAADKMAESYLLSFGLPVSTIRPFNTYGPRQSARAIIPTVITQVLKENSIKIGSLSPLRDFTFVADTVAGFILASENPKSIGETINLGQGECLSIGKLVETIFSLMKTEKPVVHETERIRPEKSEVQKLLCDNQKAREVLGWKPTVSFEEGLKKTIRWMENHSDKYKTGVYNR